MGRGSCDHRFSSYDHERKKRDHCHTKCGRFSKSGGDIKESHVCYALPMIFKNHCVKIVDSCAQIESPVRKGVNSVKTNKYAQNVHLKSNASSVNILWNGGNHISKECNMKMVNSSTQVSICSKHCSDLRGRIKTVNSSDDVGTSLRCPNKRCTKNQHVTSTSPRHRVRSCESFELLSRNKHSSISRPQYERNVHRSDETQLGHYFREPKSPELPDFLNPNTQNDVRLGNINFSPKSKITAKSKSNSAEKSGSLRSRSTNYSFHHKRISEPREHLQNTEIRDNFSKERSHNPSANGNFLKPKNTANFPGFSSAQNHISSNPSSNDYTLSPRHVSDSKKYLQSRKRENTFLRERQGISRNEEQRNKLKPPQMSRTKSCQLSSSAYYVNRIHQSPHYMCKLSEHRQSSEKQQNLSTTSKFKTNKTINKTYIKSNSQTQRMYTNVSNNLSTISTTISNSKWIDDETYTIPDYDENEDYVILPYVPTHSKTSRENLYKSHETLNILESEDELGKSVAKLPVTLDDVDSREPQVIEMHASSFTLKSKQSFESNAKISGGSDYEKSEMQTLRIFESYTKPHPNELLAPNSNKFYHNDAYDNPKSKYQLTTNCKSKICEKATLTSERQSVYKHKGNNENLSISPQLQKYNLSQISSKSESSIESNSQIQQIVSIDAKERTRKKPSISLRSQPCNLGQMSSESCSIAASEPKNQLPANALKKSKPYFNKTTPSSSQSFPMRALGSPRSRQDDLSLQKESKCEIKRNTPSKQKNDQPICLKDYSRLDTLQSDQSISPRSFQNGLSTVHLQQENSLPVSGKDEAIMKFERDVRLQFDEHSQKNRLETASFIKEEENHGFCMVKPKLYASEHNITSPILKSKRPTKSDLNLKRSPKQSETYVCASNSSQPPDISFNNNHGFQQKSSFVKLNDEKIADQNEHDIVRSKLNENNDLHSEREKTLFKNRISGADIYKETCLQTEKQRFVNLNINKGFQQNINPEIKQHIPACSKSCNNNMNGIHFVKSQSITDCSNLFRTDELSIIQPQNAENIPLKDESLIETQTRDKTMKGHDDSELQDYITYLQNRLRDCDEMVARQFAKYEPDRKESLQRSEVKMIEKMITTDSDKGENNDGISISKMELVAGNDYQINLKQEEFEEQNSVYKDNERSFQFEEEYESTSYESDIPSFTGCDCMKERYYKIMQLAYN